MRCLVTGADGFMGSHLVEALLAWDRCEHVTALIHRPQVKWLPRDAGGRLSIVIGDVQRTTSVDRLPDVDAIFHLAAISSIGRCENQPETSRLTNFQGTVNLLNRALRMSPRPVFVFTSSAGLYGEAEYLPIDERHPVDPRDHYTFSKMSAELTVFSYNKTQGLPTVVIRPFNVYGPRQSEDFVVPTVITQCLGGIEVRMGDGRPVRNFTYVTDAVNLLLRAAAFPEARGRVINLGSRQAFPISHIVEMLVELTGCGLEPVYDLRRFRDGDPSVLEMDPYLAEKLLQWHPRVWIHDGLRLTIEHWRGRLEERRRMAAGELYGRYRPGNDPAPTRQRPRTDPAPTRHPPRGSAPGPRGPT